MDRTKPYLGKVRLLAETTALLLTVLLSSCGRPDVSGIYLVAIDRNVTLVQLVETKDGVLTGRLEQVTIKADGTVKDETIPLDGAASGHDLVFKPTSIWNGGLQASGTLSGDHLTVTGAGFTLEANRSTLADYQAAVARLQEAAAKDREQVAESKATQARQVAQARAVADTANKITTLENDAARIHADMAKMNEALAHCPDYRQRAAANSARVARMLAAAPSLSSLQRSQLGVEANQVQIDTNQIEIARYQYALELNHIVLDATPIAEQVQLFCKSAQGAAFAQSCGPANSAIAEFAASLAHGREVMNGQKQAIKTELDRQTTLIRQING